jgi:hypothetical protein
MKDKFYCDTAGCGRRGILVFALKTGYMVTGKIPECPECHKKMTVV